MDTKEPENKSAGKFNLRLLFKRKYVPIYVVVLVVLVLLIAYFVMATTSFAEGSSIRNYLENAGIVPKVSTDANSTNILENTDDNSQQNQDANTDEENNEAGEPNPGDISPVYPTITRVSDGIGNTTYDSFGQNNMGNWKNPTIKEGTKLDISVTANNPNNLNLSYKFEYQPPSGSFNLLQDWSSSSTFSWTVPSSVIGKWLYVQVSVRDSDSNYRFGDADDYTYLTYQVNPKDAPAKIYPTISKVQDSNGNSTTNSWGKSNSAGWVSGKNRKLNVGDTVTFTISASDPNGDPLQYQFMYQPDGGSFNVLQDWSSSKTFTWTVPEEAVGKNIFVLLGVKDNDKYLLFGDNGDDYTYMIYDIN